VPKEVSQADAILIQHLGLLLRGWGNGSGRLVRAALQDRLHQPYRQALIWVMRGCVQQLAAGAYGMVMSGGTDFVALVDAAHSAGVETAMGEAWNNAGLQPVRSLSIDLQGATKGGH